MGLETGATEETLADALALFGRRVTSPLDAAAARRLSPYVPRLVVDWLRHTPEATVRQVEGTLAFLDISGFTRLTERLAKSGQEGAEEMSDILNQTFSTLLDVAYQDGAGLVKWGGDAVLLLFDGEDHAARGSRAAFRMRNRLREVGQLNTSAGSIGLRMSAGLHSGTFHFFLVGDPEHHRELLLAGQAASLTAKLESQANAGQVALSDATAAHLERRCLGRAVPGGRLLRAEPNIATVGIPPAKSVEGLDISAVIPRGIREQLLQQPGEAEHRTISVGFVEFSGTDELLRLEGPEAVSEALHEVIANVQKAAEHYGVTFFESDMNRDGGKVMLTAGAPTSHGHDEDRLLRAARQIIESEGRLSLRVGLNRGGVFSGDFGPPFRRTYSVKGDAINVAARVMAKAMPGQVLATRAVTDRRRTDFDLTNVGPFTVKGKTRPIDAASVGPVAATRREEASQVTIRSREVELAVLDRQLRLAESGTGSVTAIVGDRGSGRSRLVAELPALAAGMSLLATACDEYETTTPYLVVRSLFMQALASGSHDTTDPAQRLQAIIEDDGSQLAPWLPLLGLLLDIPVAPTPETDELDEEFRKLRMESSAVELMELLAPRPTIFIIDDVHHLDEASHDLVAALLVAARQRRPWAVFLTQRTGESATWIAQDEATVLQLPPLTPAGAADLVSAETEARPLPPAMVEYIVERAGGNPLFLHSLLSLAGTGASMSELPESIEGLVNVEIDQLAPAHRRVLRYAAVLGTTADEDLLERMLDDSWIPPGSPEFGPLSSFLTPTTSGQLTFRNSLMRDVAYQGLPFRRRRDLHELAGAALLAQSDVDAGDNVERLAWHFHLAGRASESWQFGRSAAERARKKFAHSEAARFLEWSVQAGRRLGIPSVELADVLELLGDTQFTLGLSADARSSYQQAARAAVHEPRRVAELQLKLGRLDQRVGQLSQSLRRLTRGMRLLSESDDPRALATQGELATRYAIGRFQQGRYRDAKVWGDRAVAIAERSKDILVLADAHNALEAITLWSGLTSEVAHGEVALGLYEELGDLAGQGHSLNNLAIRAIFEGRWNDTQPLLTRAAELFERIGDVASLAAALYNQADVLVRQGRSAEAEPLLDRALRIARSVDDDETVALVLRDWGKAETRAGQFDRGLALLQESIAALTELGEPQELLDAEAAVAEWSLLKGDPEEALRAAESALSQANDDNASVLPTLHRVSGFAQLLLNNNEAARHSFDLGLAMQSPAARHEAAFLTVGRAEAARRSGEEAASDLFRQGIDTLDALGVAVPPFPPGVVPVEGTTT